MTDITKVPFDGDELVAVRDGGNVWIALKRACETLGLDYSSQLSKLKSQPWALMADFAIRDSAGRSRQTTCLSLKSFPMWLATIEAGKVAPDLRPKIERYQVDAADALYRHFFERPAAAPGKWRSPLLAESFQPWSKTWKDSLMHELFALRGEVFEGRHPRWCAWINTVIYECLLGKDTYAELIAGRRSDKARHGRNHHQLLKPEIKQRFDDELRVVEALARTSASLNDLVLKMRVLYQGAQLQLSVFEQRRGARR